MNADELRALIDRPTWMEQAECRGLTSLFFTGRGESTNEAKDVCATCPVRAQCEAFAIESGELFGVWGGKTERQLRHLRRRRFTPRYRLDTAAPERDGNGRWLSKAAPIQHGTPTGYGQHRYRNEPACDDCKAAWAHQRRTA